MGKWSVQYVKKSIQKLPMKWLYVISVVKVNIHSSWFHISVIKSQVSPLKTNDCQYLSRYFETLL